MDQRARKPTDVEDVVRWACGQELPRKGRGEPIRPLTLDVGRRDSSLVGRWNWPAGFPEISPMFAAGFASAGSGASRGGPPSPDALIVEAAISGVPGRMAGWSAPEELALDIGLDVDIAGAFAAAVNNAANLLLAHGRLGNRPGIGAEIPRPAPRLMSSGGKPGVWRRQTIVEDGFGGPVEREIEIPAPAMKGRHYPNGAYCALVWDPDPQLIVNERADYLAWRLALDVLAEALADRLERFAVMPPAAALTPWRGDIDGDKPVDLFRSGAERVYARTEQMAIAARRESGARRPISPGRGKVRRPARVAAGEKTG